MKNIFIICFFLILLLSCRPRVYDVTAYLEVENLTTHQVNILFYNNYNLYDKDTVIVKEYNIPANFKGTLDTVKFEYTIGEDDYCIVSIPDGLYNACNVYYWRDYASIQYIFDNIKKSEIQEFRIFSFEQCDTSSSITPCLIIEEEKNEEFINRKKNMVTESIKYYITEQQYLLADSI